MQKVVDDGVGRAIGVRQGGRAGEAAAIHGAVDILAQHGETGAGTAQRLARRHMRIQQFGHRRSLPETHVVRLVAAGDEDAVRPAQPLQQGGVERRLAVLEHESLDGAHPADLAIELLADLAGIGGAQHHDMAVAGLAEEPLHGLGIAFAAPQQQQATTDRAGRRRLRVALDIAGVRPRLGRRQAGDHQPGPQQAPRHHFPQPARAHHAFRSVHPDPFILARHRGQISLWWNLHTYFWLYQTI